MKKIFAVVLTAFCLCSLLIFSGCDNENVDIAFITAGSGKNADSCFEGVKAYAGENGMTYGEYAGDCDEMLSRASADGARFMVVFNADSESAVYDFAKKHPDTKLICIDFGNDFLVSSNIFCINLSQIDCGVYAGYSAVKSGNLTVGINGEETAETCNYIRGFVEGAQIAAVEIGVSKNPVKIYYSISGSDMAVQRIASWADSGCGLVLCSDDTYDVVTEYITASDITLMTFGADRTDNENVAASAYGDYKTVVYDSLKSIFDNGFNGGTMIFVGAAENAAGFSYKSDKLEAVTDSDLTALTKTVSESNLKDVNAYKAPSDKGYSKIVLTEVGIMPSDEK